MNNTQKYMILIGKELVGCLKFAVTQKGERWLLCLYANETVLRYRDFDKAYAAAMKKKPSGSVVINSAFC